MTIADGSTALLSLDALVVDTETTGLDASQSRLVQIGAVRIEAGRLQDDAELDVLIDPGIPIPPETTAIHGIDNSMTAEAPTFAILAPDLERMLADAIVIGHNIGFDLAILKAETDRAGRRWKRPRTLDTLILARIAFPTLANYDLETLAKKLHVAVEGRHTGIGDARTTAGVYLGLLPHLREQGIRTLAEAERSSRMFGGLAVRAQEQGWLDPVLDPAGAPAAAKLDSYPYRHRVRDVMSAPAISVRAAATILEAAETLTAKGISSVIVTPDNPGDAHGIITERDCLRTLAQHKGSNLAEPASTLMSAPLQTVDADAFVYKALGRMRALGFRHLAVSDEQGAVVGVLSSGDLLRQRASDAIILGEELEIVGDVSTLAKVWTRLPQVAESLLAEGATAPLIAQVISEELRTLTRRAAELAEHRLAEEGRGPPPVPYNVLVLGSGGRGESLLVPDQDNALVYETSVSGGSHDQWFEALGTHISDILNEVGIPYCRGGVMAKSAEWRHSVDDWKNTINSWLRRGESKDVNYVDIFYDFRSIQGPAEPARAIRDHAFQQAARAPGFLKILAAMATDYRPPLGLLGRIRTEGDRVNLKAGGLLPIVGGARVLALRHQLMGRSTQERLDAARSKKLANEGDLTHVMDAHETLMEFVLRQQLADIKEGIPPSTKVDVSRLSNEQKTRLRDALRQVEVMNSIVGDPQMFG